MSEKENTALVKQAYELFTRGDIPNLLKLMSPDVDWRITHVENMPFSGRFQGPEAVGSFFAKLAGAVDLVKFDVQEFIAQGDRVVVLGDSMFKTKQHGRELPNKWAHVITVSGGKMTSFQDYGDTAAAEKAFRP
jgi:ketosteroid isomerase-like protein